MSKNSRSRGRSHSAICGSGKGEAEGKNVDEDRERDAENERLKRQREADDVFEFVKRLDEMLCSLELVRKNMKKPLKLIGDMDLEKYRAAIARLRSRANTLKEDTKEEETNGGDGAKESSEESALSPSVSIRLTGGGVQGCTADRNVEADLDEHDAGAEGSDAVACSPEDASATKMSSTTDMLNDGRRHEDNLLTDDVADGLISSTRILKESLLETHSKITDSNKTLETHEDLLDSNISQLRSEQRKIDTRNTESCKNCTLTFFLVLLSCVMFSVTFFVMKIVPKPAS
eukprot:g1766.t1